jgi:uncharacterized membrane protein (DUF485 family)
MSTVLEKSSVKRGLGICTTIYVIAFPLLCCMAFVCSLLACERATETPLTRGIIITVLSCLTLSVPAGIYLMWSRYRCNQLKKALVFAGLPLYALAAMILIFGILDAVQR